MSNPIVSPSSSPTLKSLIEQKIKEQGLSRPELVSAIGYSNISKGCRRLQNFLNTLEAPSEEFLINLCNVLEIDPVTFYRALTASFDQFNASALTRFKAYVQIKLDVDITPVFAAQMVFGKCMVAVPSTILEMPLRDEIEAITTLCEEHIDNRLSDDLSRHIIGFKYHREYNYYMRFDTAFTLEGIVFVQPLPTRKVPFGNRVADMLSGGVG